MLPQIPDYLAWAFALTAAAAVRMFHRAARLGRGQLALLLAWLTLTGALALAGFFAQTAVRPPRLPLALAPPAAAVLAAALSVRGRA